MNCSQVQEFFDDFYNNELDYNTKESVQQHLNECKECASEYSAFIILKEKAKLLKKEILPSKQIFENIEQEVNMKNDIKITPLSNNILTIDFTGDKKEIQEPKQISIFGRNWYWFATAAVILLIVSITLMNYSSKNVFTVEDMSNWKLVSLKGDAFINGVRSDKVNVGDWIQTDSVSSVILKIANVGDINIEPNTKVRFIQSDGNISKIEVMYGTVNTSTSQGDKFILQSSNMKVQDKGGSYSFNVDDKGNGVIYVNNGIANVESGDKSAVVTDGKFCFYKPEYGVGTPFRKDAKPEFQNALFQYDFNKGGTPAIYSAMANATADDYASLLNLIPRVDDKTRYLVYNKIGKLAPQALPVIDIDSLEYFDNEDIENSIKDLDNKIRIEVSFDKEELAKEMEEMRKDLAEMKLHIKIDAKKMAEDIKKEMQNLKIEIGNLDEDISDTNEMKIYFKNFDSEDFKKNMEKMKIELKDNLSNMTEELKKNAEEWKKNAEEWKQNQEEWEKQQKEWKKNENFNFNFNFDSLDIKIEGLEELQKLRDLKGFKNMTIDTAGGKHKFYFKFDDKKDKDDSDEKDMDKDDEKNDDKDSEEI